MKNFNPISLSPNINNTKRSSPRFQNDSSNDGIDMSFIVDQMKYLYDTNMQLITIVKNLQSKYDIVAKIIMNQI